MHKRLIIPAAILLVTLATGCADNSTGPSPRELKEQIAGLMDENAALKDRIAGLEAEIDEVNSELATARAERNALQKELTVLKSRSQSRARRR